MSEPPESEDTAPLSLGPGLPTETPDEAAARARFGPPPTSPATWLPPTRQPAPPVLPGAAAPAPRSGEPWPASGAGPWPYTRPGPPSDYPTSGRAPLPVHHRDQDTRAQHTHRRTVGQVPGWVWPAVAALALVVGALGGVLGAAGYDRWTDAHDSGRVEGGLAEAGARTTAPLPAANGSVAAVAAQVLPSTVQIRAEYDGQAGAATGSGFVLDGEGHVVTNNHVVAQASGQRGSIQVVDQDGNTYEATVVGRSPTYDLAVLFIEERPDLPAAALGESGQVRVGDSVVAVGSPLGLSSTVTAGIVSALDRPVTTGDAGNDSSYINAVQTDAAINPGNSGGPLVNLQGQVVGVNSAIATTGGATQGEVGNIGVGFAIPVDQVRTTADQILRTGQARYPVIGAKVVTGTGEDEGAEITEVGAGSPAEHAGLREGDLVTALDGERVSDGIALIVAIRAHRPGDDVQLSVRRGVQQLTLSVTLGSEVG